MPAAVAVESPPLPAVEVQARGYWELVWLRLRRDRMAIAGGLVVLLLLACNLLGAACDAFDPRALR
jgi:peptide/nickel transport system permease protein